MFNYDEEKYKKMNKLQLIDDMYKTFVMTKKEKRQFLKDDKDTVSFCHRTMYKYDWFNHATHSEREEFMKENLKGLAKDQYVPKLNDIDYHIKETLERTKETIRRPARQ